MRMSDTHEISNAAAFTYATSKLDAAAVLSASYRQDIYQAHDLGFIGTAYTAAHEGMELLLKVYLKRGLDRGEKEVWGHDLGKLFMQWDEQGRTTAEVAYQNYVWKDLRKRSQAAALETLRLGRHRELPPDYSERKAEDNDAYRQYQIKLLHEGSPTVEEVVKKLDTVLGARNITTLYKSAQADNIKGFPYGPEVWYPKEVLSTKWGRLVTASQQGESLGFVEAFLKREGTKEVFEGWRYLDERKLEKAGMSFHGPPAKMIDMAQSLENVVWKALSQG